jgi:uncharacterized protein YggE
MESKPDTIKISISRKEEIFADRADLFVTVRGSSVVGGDQALRKAKEVNQLVEALEQVGVKEEAVQLRGVHIETASGVLLKSSSASYRLKVRCEKLEQLAALLDGVAGQKNAVLERIEWKYPEDAARERGLDAALAQARNKAVKVAAALGVSLLGVYDLIENAFDEETPFQPFAAQAMPMRAAARGAPEPSLGMEIQHSKTITVNVDIWYRVSAFQ